ncbi:MAG: hypothetical protein M1814_001151 [Vezdaea aestivalis]|nr:MAG: hypothetical protein M1814_001151 [Vezdaea aestivalis]
MAEGYEAFLVDAPYYIRSLWPQTVQAFELTILQTEFAFTAPEKANPLAYPQASLHTQWPGMGAPGGPAFELFADAAVGTPFNIEAQEAAVAKGGCQLLRKIGRQAIILAHSLGGVNPTVVGDICRDMVKSTVLIEADQTPFQNRDAGTCFGGVMPFGLTFGPLTCSPAIQTASDLKIVTLEQDLPDNHSCMVQAEPARKLPNLAKIPTLFITGEASFHVTYDHCQVYFMPQAGIDVK